VKTVVDEMPSIEIRVVAIALSLPATAWFYNFGQGGRSVSSHSGGDKQMAVSVRCVRE
jgi:hypothetical protein